VSELSRCRGALGRAGSRRFPWDRSGVVSEGHCQLKLIHPIVPRLDGCPDNRRANRGAFWTYEAHLAGMPLELTEPRLGSSLKEMGADAFRPVGLGHDRA